jgi:hypothetical protein
LAGLSKCTVRTATARAAVRPTSSRSLVLLHDNVAELVDKEDLT